MKRTLSKANLWSLTGLALGLILIGCGGGGSGGGGGLTSGSSGGGSNGGTGGTLWNGDLAASQGKLDSGEQTVLVGFRAKKSGPTSLTVSSDAMDPYALVESVSPVEVLACDDDAGGGSTSRLDFTLTSGATYRLLVCAVDGRGTGVAAVRYQAADIEFDAPSAKPQGNGPGLTIQFKPVEPNGGGK